MLIAGDGPIVDGHVLDLHDDPTSDVTVDVASSVAQAQTRLLEASFDVVVIAVPADPAALAGYLDDMRRSAPALPRVVLGAAHDQRSAVEALRHGAEDYLEAAAAWPAMLHHVMDHLSERRRLRQRLVAAAEGDPAHARPVEASGARPGRRPAVVGTTGHALHVRRWNTAAQEIFGLPAAAASGTPLASLLATQADRFRLDEGFARAADTGVWDADVLARRLDGQPFRAALVMNRAETSGATPDDCVVVITDLSEPERSPADYEALAGELTKRMKELRLLAEAATLLADPASDVHEVLNALVRRLPDAFVHAEAATARIVYERGLQRHEASSHTGSSPLRTSRSIDLGDAGRLFTEVGYRDLPGSGDEVFLPEEQRLLDAVATMLAGYLERRLDAERSRSLRSELERRDQVRRALLDVFTRYLSGDTEDAAGMLLDAVLATVPYARLGSVLVRTRRGTYRYAAQRGYAETLADVELSPEIVLFGHDWRAGRVFAVRDIAGVNERVEQGHPELRGLTDATRSAAAVESLIAPVVVDGALIAAIAIEHTDAGRTFGEETGDLLQLFAQSIGALLLRAEGEARADLMAQAVNAASDGIAVVELPVDGSPAWVRHANPAFAAMLEFDRTGTPQRWDPTTLLDDAIAEEVMATARTVVTTGVATRLELPIPSPDGRRAWVEVGASRLDEDEHSARLLVRVRDITDRYEHLARLERVTDDLQARLSEMEALEAIDAAITRRHEGDWDPLTVVVDVVARRPGMRAVGLLVADDTDDELRLAAATGALRQLRSGHRISSLDPAEGVRREGRPRRLDDFAAAIPGTPSAGEGGLGGTYHAWPLVSRGQVVGVLEALLEAGFEPPHEWSRFMETLSAQVAIAVEHTAMIERLQHSASAYARLAEFSGQIEESDDPEELIDIGVRTLMHEFAMQGAACFVTEGDDLVLDRTWGEVPELMLPILREPQRPGNGAIGIAAARGEAIFVEDYAHWPEADSDVARKSLASVLAVPVRSERGSARVIAIVSFARTVSLRPDQLSIARAFVRRLEHALERAAHQQQIERSREEAFRSLGVALEYRDYETKGHTDRVVALARRLGRRVGLDDDALEALSWGAYLHDLGKITISDQILLKPARLTPEEFEEVKRHTVTGFEMSLDLAFLPDATRAVIRSHHERWDGCGYPDRLAGDAIPYLARVFALADVYDALRSERPYKRAWSHDEAVAELAAHAGTQFDPTVTAAMLTLLAEEPVRPHEPASVRRG